MSIQYGWCNFDHRNFTANPARVRETLRDYQTATAGEYSATGIYLLYLPFHATRESELEKQPFVSSSGQIVLWDGRLDNRQELIGALRSELRGDCSDVAIVAAALDSWGIAALSKLIGDWALSVCNAA